MMRAGILLYSPVDLPFTIYASRHQPDEKIRIRATHSNAIGGRAV